MCVWGVRAIVGRSLLGASCETSSSSRDKVARRAPSVLGRDGTAPPPPPRRRESEFVSTHLGRRPK